MNEKNKLITTVVFIVVFFTILFFLSGANTPKIAETFEECTKQGNPVMESYPRQCRDKKGNLFVENIGNELEKNNLIRIYSPRPNQVVKSPIVIEGEARGYWFFEASFPVVLTDWDGKIIAQHYAEAQDSWMTEEFVPFKTTLEFENLSWEDEFSKRGTLILQKDNPSGLPEHDDALEIPILFE
ncbi:MAG: Gmad2 immunoglobulin-like domain-containing protein [Parcubacteria group bacterium]|nr:Gmad2 immunoglobulin-like domain-containing protein [Parcubacteria group bacterium]